MHHPTTGHAAARYPALLLPLLLLAACGGGGSRGGGGNNDPDPPASVTVSGTISYEYVPATQSCQLNFDPAVREVRPIRGATVQLRDAAGVVVATTTSDTAGNYGFTGLEPNTTFSLRIRAELEKTTGSSRWDVEIRDNVDTSAAPPPLASRPLYVLDSASFSSGSTGVDIDVTAETGWVGSGYANERAAAPFAILDAIYEAMTFIERVDPDVVFAPLDVFWSINNNANDPDPDEQRSFIDMGTLGGSFYRIGQNQLFLTGDANGDTEEFDSHIVVHEWGHYFEDNLSRSDNPGGTHFLGDKLDARLALSEGWATALAAMALDDPRYCESRFAGSSFGINAEGGAFGGQGWYDEISVLRFIYDLWDTTNEGTDTGSIGFVPIYETMRGRQAATAAWTTLFSFATELKAMLDATGAALLDAQLGDEQVTGDGINIWGDGETNAGGATEDVLPIYIDYTAGDPPRNICSNSQFDLRVPKDGNKLSEFRYLRIEVPADGLYHVTITSTTPTPPSDDPEDRDQSDPDMFIRRGNVLVAELTSWLPNLETTMDVAEIPEWTGPGPLSLEQGTYAADLRDWRFSDDIAAVGYPDRVCFDVEFSLAP